MGQLLEWDEIRKFKIISPRIPMVKLKIPGKCIFKIQNQNFCYIQVIVFDLSYLPVEADRTQQVRFHEKIVKNIKSVFRISKMLFPEFSISSSGSYLN